MFEDILDLRGLHGSPTRCSACHADGKEIDMVATEAFDPSQQLRVSAWECPECGRTVYRDSGDSPTLFDPPQ
jgi:predicted RNA-binding Zn-ribbon protein involved in translation (DUF1610 family)